MTIEMPVISQAVEAVLAELHNAADVEEYAKICRRVPADQVIGVRMRTVFELAKTHQHLPLSDVQALLDEPFYEARMVAVAILDFKARRPRTTEEERRALFQLYLDRHDRIDTWDLVDRAAPRVIGAYLLGRPHAVLFELADSADVWRRRTAITAAFWLIRFGNTTDLDDALIIAERLLDDDRLIQNSVGTALREVGRVDAARHEAFLDRHAARISPATRRLAVS